MQIHIRMLALLLMVGCSDGGSSAPPDAAPDALVSTCGNPGDTGNELGIGRFCASLGDCTDPRAPLCSILGDQTTHFCTKTCSSTGAPDQCGSVTECVCNANNQCGCTPTACLGP